MQDSARIDRIVSQRREFSTMLGLRYVSASSERIVAELEVSQALANRNGHMHGGAVMAIADDIAGTATFYCLADGQGTVTLESKTNFFRPIEIGDTIRIEATPLHQGRKTMVWQIRICRSDGKLAAAVIQTQFIT